MDKYKKQKCRECGFQVHIDLKSKTSQDIHGIERYCLPLCCSKCGKPHGWYCDDCKTELEDYDFLCDACAAEWPQIFLALVEAGVADSDTEVFALRIDGKPVSEEGYAAIPEEPLNGEPLGRVNVHRRSCAGLSEDNHLHILWLNADGELRTSCIYRDPPPGTDAAIWAESYTQMEALDQIFINL